MLTELQQFPPCVKRFSAARDSVSEWVDISLPAIQDVGLMLRRSVDAVNRLPVISVQVSASLCLQTALLMRSKVGLSHTACYACYGGKASGLPDAAGKRIRGLAGSVRHSDQNERQRNT